MAAGALERAVGLLEQIGTDRTELTVAELADQAGMPTSTTYRLLAELERHGLIARSGGTVALGTKMVLLGRSAQASLHQRLIDPATAPMERLAADAGETVLLTAPCGLRGTVLHVVETEQHAMRLSYAVFREAPMHLGASGKVLAAFLSEPERRRLLASLPEDVAATLRSQLALIRTQGYAFTVGELDAGAAAVGAPIRDRHGNVLAGLSVAGPEHRVVPHLDRIVDEVKHAAMRVEQNCSGC